MEAVINGPDTIELGQEVSLSAINSSGTNLNYQWLLIGKPEESTVTLSSTDQDTAFTPDMAGEYTVMLNIHNDDIIDIEGTIGRLDSDATITKITAVVS